MKPFSPSVALLAVALTSTAGFVDAIGYLNLGHVYVANMSGNSIALGIDGSHWNGAEVWRFGWPILSFTCGLLVSRLVVTWGIELHWRSIAAPAIAVEAIALAGFMAIPGGDAGVFLAACAMGIQAATLSRFNDVTVYTSFVTGSLVKFTEHLSDYLTGRSSSNLRRAVWFAGVWAAYVTGAFLGAMALAHIAKLSIPLAIAALAGLAAMDLISPSQVERSVDKN